MPTWKAYLLRAIGAAGLYFDSVAVFRVMHGVRPAVAYFHLVFPFVCAVAVAWFACCFVSGIYLWRGNVRGYRFARLLALLQISYTVVLFSLPLFFRGEAYIQVTMAIVLAYVKVDNRLSLYYALLMLFFLVLFFRKSDFRAANHAAQAIPVTVVGEKLFTSRRAAGLVRGLGIANIVFGFLGMALTLIDVAATYLHRDALIRDGFSFETSLIGGAIDFGLLAGLLFAGYLLDKLDRRGVILSNFILSAEILYWVAATLAPPLSSFTNFGLVPQLLTAYPLLALPLLNWGARRIDRCRAWKGVPAT